MIVNWTEGTAPVSRLQSGARLSLGIDIFLHPQTRQVERSIYLGLKVHLGSQQADAFQAFLYTCSGFSSTPWIFLPSA